MLTTKLLANKSMLMCFTVLQHRLFSRVPLSTEAGFFVGSCDLSVIKNIAHSLDHIHRVAATLLYNLRTPLQETLARLCCGCLNYACWCEILWSTHCLRSAPPSQTSEMFDNHFKTKRMGQVAWIVLLPKRRMLSNKETDGFLRPHSRKGIVPPFHVEKTIGSANTSRWKRMGQVLCCIASW